VATVCHVRVCSVTWHFPRISHVGRFLEGSEFFVFGTLILKTSLRKLQLKNYLVLRRQLFGSQGEHCFVFALEFVWLLSTTIWFLGRTVLRVCIGFRLIIIGNYLVLGENIASSLHWISSDYYRQLFGSRGEHCFVFALDFVWLLSTTIWFSGRTLLRVCIGFRLAIIDNYLVLRENIASCLHWISSDYCSQLFVLRKNCNCFELK